MRVTSGAPNPFVNWPNSDFRLVAENTDWGAGSVLASPYNLDMIGNFGLVLTEFGIAAPLNSLEHKRKLQRRRRTSRR